MPASIDPQKIGWRDDGSGEGAIATAEVASGLALVPFDFNVTTAAGGTGGTCTQNRATGIAESLHSSLFMATGANATSYATAKTMFAGKRLGLAINTGYATAVDNLTVVIDGTPYHVSWRNASLDSTFIANGVLKILYADDLPDGVHELKLKLVACGALQTVNIYGLLLERRLGYAPVSMLSSVLATPYLMPSTNPITIPVMAASSTGIRLLAGITFRNTDSSDQTVAPAINGVQFTDSITIAAGKSWSETYSPPVAMLNTAGGLTFAASVANKIYATVRGVF